MDNKKTIASLSLEHILLEIEDPAVNTFYRAVEFSTAVPEDLTQFMATDPDITEEEFLEYIVDLGIQIHNTISDEYNKPPAAVTWNLK